MDSPNISPEKLNSIIDAYKGQYRCLVIDTVINDIVAEADNPNKAWETAFETYSERDSDKLILYLAPDKNAQDNLDIIIYE